MKEILVKYDVGWYRTELVECKDCKRWSEVAQHNGASICLYIRQVTNENDFCSRAEKRESNE